VNAAVNAVVQSTEMRVVTNGRTTGDYHANLTDNWAIGIPSVLVLVLHRVYTIVLLVVYIYIP
jgi:hypothetical protein